MRLLWIILVGTLSLSAQQWSFPHDEHLRNGLSCTDCHADVAKSKESGDHLLPSSETCDTCHSGQIARPVDTAPLDEKEPMKRTFRFNHEQHLAMGNLAPLIAAAIDDDKYMGKPGDIRRFLNTQNNCVACHRGLKESSAVVAKVHMPQMADCIVCHNEIDNPFTCPDCHDAGIDLKPASHTRQFIDLHSTGKLGLDKQTCLPCHGKNFGCMGCH